jgi:hypothetical protein
MILFRITIILILFLTNCDENNQNYNSQNDGEGIPYPLIKKEDVFIVNSKIIITTTWKIKEKNIINALESIKEFLNDPYGLDEYDKDKIDEILKHINIYKVQLFGITEEGKKKIFCSFYPREDDIPLIIDEEDEKSKNHQLRLLDKDYEWSRYNFLNFVDDGGTGYWRITYDIETGKCSDFNTNGEA